MPGNRIAVVYSPVARAPLLPVVAEACRELVVVSAEYNSSAGQVQFLLVVAEALRMARSQSRPQDTLGGRDAASRSGESGLFLLRPVKCKKTRSLAIFFRNQLEELVKFMFICGYFNRLKQRNLFTKQFYILFCIIFFTFMEYPKTRERKFLWVFIFIFLSL